MIEVVTMREMVVILSDCGASVHTLVFRKTDQLVEDTMELIEVLWAKPEQVLTTALKDGLNLWEGDVVARYQLGALNLMIHGQAIPITWNDLNSLHEKLGKLIDAGPEDPPVALQKVSKKPQKSAEQTLVERNAKDPAVLQRIKNDGGPPVIVYEKLMALVQEHGTNRVLMITSPTMRGIREAAGIKKLTRRVRFCVNVLLHEQKLRLDHRYFLGRPYNLESLSDNSAIRTV